MSADNYVTISTKTFEIRDCCASTDDKGNIIGKGKDLDDAVRIYREWLSEEMFEPEYGVCFID